MRRKTKVIIVLITTIIFTNGIDLHAQNKKGQLLDATTPQGLWVKVNPDKNARIEQLCMAKSKVFGKDQLLSFEKVFSNDDFVSFLQTNNGSVVLSEVPKGLKFEDSLYAIDDWVANFEFDQTQSIENRPIIIFKFTRKSIAEMLKNKGLASEFTTSSNLETVKAYIEKVKKKLIHNEHYAHINKVLNDPNWNGILGINLKVDSRSLPAELQIATASMDKKHLPWDHLGITLKPFNENRGLTSAFGLIDYKFTRGNKGSGDLNAPYWSLQLLVGFENSSIKTYSSTIDLNMDLAATFWSKKGQGFSTYELEHSLYEEPNIYSIKGIYQLSNGVPYYSFIGEDGRRPVGPLLKSIKLKGSQ